MNNEKPARADGPSYFIQLADLAGRRRRYVPGSTRLSNRRSLALARSRLHAKSSPFRHELQRHHTIKEKKDDTYKPLGTRVYATNIRRYMVDQCGIIVDCSGLGCEIDSSFVDRAN